MVKGPTSQREPGIQPDTQNIPKERVSCVWYKPMWLRDDTLSAQRPRQRKIFLLAYSRQSILWIVQRFLWCITMPLLIPHMKFSLSKEIGRSKQVKRSKNWVVTNDCRHTDQCSLFWFFSFWESDCNTPISNTYFILFIIYYFKLTVDHLYFSYYILLLCFHTLQHATQSIDLWCLHAL